MVNGGLMVTLTFRSGRSLPFKRTDQLDVLNADNTTTRIRATDIAPGAIVVGLGMVLLYERDGQISALPQLTDNRPVRRMSV